MNQFVNVLSYSLSKSLLLTCAYVKFHYFRIFFPSRSISAKASPNKPYELILTCERKIISR